MRAVAPLSEVAQFIRGITFKPDDVVPVGTPGSVPCMRTKNVQVELDLSDLWAVDSSLVKREEQYLRSGDILVSSANSWNLVGKCCPIPDSAKGATFGGFIATLRPDSSRVDPRYLYYWFSSPRIQKTVRSFGKQTTNIANLDFSRCLGIGVPLPSMSEQRAVVQVLDQVATLRAKRRDAIALLDEAVQSIFIDQFGDPAANAKRWPIRKVADLVDSTTYGTGAKADLSGTIPVLRMNNLTRTGEMNLSNLKYMDRDKVEDRHIARRGDVLFNRTNSADLVGKTAIYREVEPVAYAGYLIRVRMNSQNHPEYLAAFMNTPYAKLVLRNMCKSIIGMANINARELKSIDIAEPPLHLQQEFAERMLAVEQLRLCYRAHLAELDALFASLQHRAFLGQLWPDRDALGA